MSNEEIITELKAIRQLLEPKPDPSIEPGENYTSCLITRERWKEAEKK